MDKEWTTQEGQVTYLTSVRRPGYLPALARTALCVFIFAAAVAALSLYARSKKKESPAHRAVRARNLRAAEPGDGIVVAGDKAHVFAAVRFADEVAQRFACDLRKVTDDRQFEMIVDKFLQGFAGEPGAQYEEIVTECRFLSTSRSAPVS